jgi:predicted nucleic acid-binding protein
VEISVPFPRDAEDAKFLACALAADADFLITGDLDFSGARKLGNTKLFRSANSTNWLSVR